MIVNAVALYASLLVTAGAAGAAGASEAEDVQPPGVCTKIVKVDPPEPRLGDVFIVYVRQAGTSTSAKISVLGFEIPLLPIAKDCLRGVGAVPLDIPARSYAMQISAPGAPVEWPLVISDREFDSSELNVSARFTSKQPAAVRARLKREEKAWQAMWDPPPTTPRWIGVAERPVPGEVTGRFGTRRTFNGTKQSTHYGLDLNAAVGEPVRAMAAGKVVMSSMRYVSGGTIVLDHGNGLFSAYFHLSKRSKNVGDRVGRGDRLGLAGKSGRVTGPHLHLSIMVRMLREPAADEEAGMPVGLYVDPEALLDLRLLGDPDYLAKDAKTAKKR